MSDLPLTVAAVSRPSRVALSRGASPGRLGATWFRLGGELDLSAVPLVSAQLRDAQAGSYLVVADLRDLDFLDCSGLGVLVAAETRARRSRRSFVVVRGSGQVDRMLALSGLLGWLEVVDLRAVAPAGVPS